jgi:adenosylmethionine-8-amino-7-oxononanoate aminotransferase
MSNRQNPTRAKLVTIGKSYEGRTIYGVQVLGASGDVVNATKPKMFFDGGNWQSFQHPRLNSQMVSCIGVRYSCS